MSILQTSATLSRRLTLDVKSLFAGEVNRSPVSTAGGDGLWVSGSAGYGRFLIGSLRKESSAWRLRAAPLLKLSESLTAGQRVCKLSVPVLAGGAGEPLVPRASLTKPVQSGLLALELPRSRLVVRKSSGAVATDWLSPFMVMILGINWRQGSLSLEEFQVCDNFIDTPSKVTSSAL